MTQRERQILQWIEADPMISQEALAERAGITRSSVAVHISNLMKKGYITGKGYIVRTDPYVAVVGGVAANSVIRADLHAACGKAGVRLFLPPLKWCGDNGAMIGAQGYYEYQAGRTAGLDLNAYATMDLGAPLL